MTEDARKTLPDQFQRNIVARPLGKESVITTIGVGPGQRGPWSLVTGISSLEVDMVSPPPQYLSVVAWAA